jgi:hypothetical protein
MSITLVVNAPAAACPFANTATVTATQPDPTPGNNAATSTVTVAAAAAAVPTLSEWMLALLGILLGLAAVLKLK